MKSQSSFSNIIPQGQIPVPDTQKRIQKIGIIYESVVLILLFASHTIHLLISGNIQIALNSQGFFILFNFYIFGASFIVHLLLGFLKNHKTVLIARTVIRILVWVIFIVNIVENQVLSEAAQENQDYKLTLVYSCLGAYILIVIQQGSFHERIAKIALILTSMGYISIRICIDTGDPIVAVFGGILIIVIITFFISLKKEKKKRSLPYVPSTRAKDLEISMLNIMLGDIDEGFLVLQDNQPIYYSNRRLLEMLDANRENLVMNLNQIKNFTTLSSEGQASLRVRIGEENGASSEKDLDEKYSEKRPLPLLRHFTTDKTDKTRGEFGPRGSWSRINTGMHSTSFHPLMTTEKSPMESTSNLFKGGKSFFKSQSLRRAKSISEKKKKESLIPFMSVVTGDEININKDIKLEMIQKEPLNEPEEFIFKDGILGYFTALQSSFTRDQLENLSESNEYASEYMGYLNHLDSRVKLFNLKLQPFYINGRFMLVIRLKDITEKELLCLLKQSEKERSNMVSSVSHELRTPLNCIITMLDLIEENVTEDVKESYLLPASHSAKLLLNLVNDILDYSQSRAKTLKLVYTHFNLRQHLVDILKLMRLQAEGKGLELKFEFDERVSLMVYSEPNRLRQIIINLIGNALKFTVKGSIRLKVSYVEPDVCRISIIDTGIGIKPENIKELFRQFSRVMDNININRQGVGLGLAISNMLAKELGPNRRGISVDSIYGQGSTFCFEIENKIEMAKKQMDGDFESFDDEGSKQLNRNIKSLQDKAQEAHQQMTKLFQKEKFTPFILRSGYSKISSYVRTITVEKEELSVSSIQVSDKNTPLDLQKQRFKKKTNSFSHYVQLNGLSMMNRSNSTLNNAKGSNFGMENIDEIVLADEKPLIKSRHIFEEEDMTGKYNKSQKRIKFVSGEIEKDKKKEKEKEREPEEADFLVVDDNPFNILPLTKILENLGFKVDSATNGDLAIEKFLKREEANNSYKIIFMDCQMPIKDGYETTKEIRRLEAEKNVSKIPIVAVTASNYANDVRKCFESGMDDYVQKPVHAEIVKGIIEKVINKRL